MERGFAAARQAYLAVFIVIDISAVVQQITDNFSVTVEIAPRDGDFSPWFTSAPKRDDGLHPGYTRPLTFKKLHDLPPP